MVLSLDCMPVFTPTMLKASEIPVFQTVTSLMDELANKSIDRAEALSLYDQMCAVRALEEMIYQLRSGAYEPLAGKYEYQGPTHLSIGQEGASVGACSILNWDDYITSTHRGHGDSMAKGYAAILHMNRAQMDARIKHYDVKVAAKDDEAIRAELLADHIYRSICELFGKEHGYCKGRGGSMHIADFSLGHLGANAIVGGGTPIATGAGYASRYLEDGKVAMCFVGDGAFSNGITLESLNMATMPQFENGLQARKFGVPTVFAILNNLYAMTGQTHGELCDVPYLAARAWGFAEDGMQAEVVNGMDVLSVRKSMKQAVDECRAGRGPILRELITYRYYGHSLSDPRKAYRRKEEETAWRDIDPLLTFGRQLIECGLASQADLDAMYKRSFDRNAEQAVKAAFSPDPDSQALYQYLYATSTSEKVPAQYAKAVTVGPVDKPKRDKDGLLTYKDAIKEAMIEEFLRDSRVLLYGEDLADYGGAFFVTSGMLETFGRDRVFNTSISESAICGTAVGAAMAGLRPIVELMYFDFALQASDQISNQAAKWHYMSGGMRTVPMVIRASAGGGKGYGGQHSQSIESIFCHTPGLKIAVPSNPYDAKGLLKTAIRDDNPVLYVEGQLLYGMKGQVPEEEYLIPFGVAKVKREGRHATFVGWSYVVNEAMKAADILAKDHGIELEVIDARTLVPFDWETVIASAKKTGKVVVGSQAVKIGSFTAEVADTITRKAFDYLDCPVERLGAAASISPQAKGMEKAYLPWAEDVVKSVLGMCGKKA
ncbi:MAG: pyruvate dehydrogenase [Planctomycetes bacterium]|nr:pyruvate dehydrogenase [Planctomycetota bacterium]